MEYIYTYQSLPLAPKFPVYGLFESPIVLLHGSGNEIRLSAPLRTMLIISNGLVHRRMLAPALPSGGRGFGCQPQPKHHRQAVLPAL